MHITSILFYKVHNIPYRFRGKFGKRRKPTLRDIYQYKRDLEREEANMLILRHPYLTAEQSNGHMSHLRQQKVENVMTKFREDMNAKFNRKVTIMDRLGHLKVAESWD